MLHTLRRIVDYPYLRLRKGKIIDFGFKYPFLLMGNCIGIDNDRKAIVEAQNKGKNVIYGDLETPFSVYEKFDTVTIIYLLHHTNNIDMVLDNAVNHMKENGRVLIVEPYDAFDGNTTYKEYLFKKLTNRNLVIEKMFDWFGRTKGFEVRRAYVILAKKSDL